MTDYTFVAKNVVTRKHHRCNLCYSPIPIGERCAYWAGVFDGQAASIWAHAECESSRDSEEYCPGDFPTPQRILDLYNRKESA
jgi:hypothetical protein